MKKPIIYLIFMCMAALAMLNLTSCLSNDDDENGWHVLSTQERVTCLSNTAGNFNGYFIYSNRVDQKVDSLVTNWQITASDSLLHLNMPMNFLNKIMPQDYDPEILSMFKTVEPQPVNFILHAYYNDKMKLGLCTYEVEPPTSITFSTRYNEKDYTVSVSFDRGLVDAYSQVYYSYAEYYQMAFVSNIIIKSVTINDKEIKLPYLAVISGKR